MRAADKGHLEVVTRLIEAGSKVDLQDKVSPALTAVSGVSCVWRGTEVNVCGLGIGIRVKGRVVNPVGSG